MCSKMCLDGTSGKADLKKYEVTSFETGFEVLQVSSQKLCESQGATDPLAAVAMCVEVGSFSDPDVAQGIAHFLEHMIFMGSEKYPDENAYDSYVSSHGGSCNAMTEGEYTIYQFVVSGEKETFAHALDIFAQCFISPLLSSSCSDREINSIESEFQLAKTSDGSRMQQIFCGNCTNTTVPEGQVVADLAAHHVLKKFGWGNNFSLKTVPEEQGADINSLLREFYRTHYRPGRMKLVVLSPLPMEDITTSVAASFAPWVQTQGGSQTTGSSLQKKQKLSSGDFVALASLQVGDGGSEGSLPLPALSALLGGKSNPGIPIYDRYPQHHAFPYKVHAPVSTAASDGGSDLSASRLIRMVPIKNAHCISVKFQLPCMTGLYDQKLESYYGHLFGHEGKGSVLSLLKRLNFATGLSAGVGSDSVSCNSAFSIFEIYVSLTSTGVCNWPFVVAILYEYIHLNRELGPQEWVFDELKKMAQIEYDYLDEVDEEEYVESMAIEMSAAFNRRRSDLLSAAFLYRNFNAENLSNMLSYFTPENAIVELMSSCYRDPNDIAAGDDKGSDSGSDAGSDSGSDDGSDSDGSSDGSEGEDEEDEEEGESGPAEEVDIPALYQGPSEWFWLVQNPFICPDVDCDAPNDTMTGATDTDADAVVSVVRTPKEEPYFQTKYFEDQIPASVIRMWAYISAHGSGTAAVDSPVVSEYSKVFSSNGIEGASSTLHLPSPNAYIPDISSSVVASDQEEIGGESLVPEKSGCAGLCPVLKRSAQQEPVVTGPTLLHADDGFHCWFYRNSKYEQLPKIDIRVVIYSSEICSSPLNKAKTDLLVYVVKEFLQDTHFYPASLCDLEASLYTSNDVGIGISVQGYSDKSFCLLQSILSALIVPDSSYCCPGSAVDNIISGKYDQLLRNYRNYDMSASRAASHARLALLNRTHYGAEEARVALENEYKVGAQTSGGAVAALRSLLSAHAKKILSHACVNMMVHGNCARTVAQTASAEAYQTLCEGAKLGRSCWTSKARSANEQSLSWIHHPGKRTVKLTNSAGAGASVKGKKGKGTGGGKHYIYHVIPGNPIEGNVSCELYYQLPDQDFSACARGDKESPYFLDLLYLSLLEELLCEPFFDRLRTQQQLGYSVSCSFKNNCGVLGYQFSVTSSLYTAATIESSMFQFVDSVATSLLPNMSDELFGQYVSAFVSKQTKVEANLVAHSNKYIWDSVSDRDYAFGLYTDTAEVLKCMYLSGAKSLVDLRVDLIGFANRLFTGTTVGAPNTQNVLIVRSYHEHVNAQKQDGFDCASTGNSGKGDACLADEEGEVDRVGKGTGRVKRVCLCAKRGESGVGVPSHCQVCLPSGSARRKVKEVLVQDLVTDFHGMMSTHDNLT